ncbi:MAG: hypothetical protein Rubg2KO_41410 [Rubricoccaceae bacterium]
MPREMLKSDDVSPDTGTENWTTAQNLVNVVGELSSKPFHAGSDWNVTPTGIAKNVVFTK